MDALRTNALPGVSCGEKNTDKKRLNVRGGGQR